MNLQDCLRRATTEECAFQEIYDMTIDRVFSFTLLRVRNRDVALDTCQNIYLALWKSLPRFRYVSDAHFYAYLFTLVRRTIARVYRAQEIAPLLLEDAFDVPAHIPAWEDYRELLRHVHKLKEKERLCVELRYFQDWKFQDIATALAITENHAKVLHHRALKKLQRSLGFSFYASS